VPADRALRFVRFFFFRLIFFPCRVVSCADSWHFKRSVYSVAWSKDGKVASGSRDKSVKIWETSTGECLSTLRGHKEINCIAFSPDGKIFAAGDGDMVWDEAGSVRLYDTVTGDVKSTLSGHNDPVFSVCFSPCGTKIVSGGGIQKEYGGNGDLSIRIWDAETGTQIGSPLSGHSGW
jgi:WD40 repeat protein